MSTSARPPERRTTSAHRLPTGTAITVGVLLLIPVLGLMLIPTYARSGPKLFGFPFFYWYQMAWVFAAAAFTYASYRIIAHARGRR